MMPSETLLALALGELEGDARDEAEAHLFECSACAAEVVAIERVGRGVRAWVGSSQARFIATPALVAELEGRGLITRRYALGAGDVVPCHVEPEDVYVLTTLRADVFAATRVDLLALGMRFEDVPFDRSAGAVLLVDAASFISSLPTMKLELSLVAVDAAGDRALGQFFLDHDAGAT